MDIINNKKESLMNKYIVMTVALSTTFVFSACKSTAPSKPIAQYTPNEYLLLIKDNVDPGMFNLGALGESIKNGQGYTEISNWSCGSNRPNSDLNKINHLWSKYCTAKGGVEYKRNACLNKSKEVLFITSTNTRLRCDGQPNGATLNKFTTKIILPSNNADDEGFAARLKEYGYKTDKELELAAIERESKRQAEIDEIENILNIGKTKHHAEVSSKIKGNMVCRNIRKSNYENKQYYTLKGFIEDNANQKLKVSIALISNSTVKSKNSYPVNTSVEINGVSYTKGQELWDDSENWFLCS